MEQEEEQTTRSRKIYPPRKRRGSNLEKDQIQKIITMHGMKKLNIPGKHAYSMADIASLVRKKDGEHPSVDAVKKVIHRVKKRPENQNKDILF